MYSAAPMESPCPIQTVPRTRLALRLLLEAWECAQRMKVSPWEFAVEIATFHAVGITNTDLRWLLSHGFVEHGIEVTAVGQPHRDFRRLPNLTLPKRTCFILTTPGVARSLVVVAGMDPDPKPALVPAERTAVPTWNAQLRELRLGEHLVKSFRQPAVSQEIVLNSFEEVAWSPRIDDPLPPRRGRDSKRHLHDTVNNLNRNQKHRLIRFSGDGNGVGICWKVAVPSASWRHQSDTRATPANDSMPC